MQGNMNSLLTSKRFLPLFLTQFLGAFNDNIFKNSLIMLIVFKIATDASLYTNLAAALFILPFFLFSAMAGQIAEAYEKSYLIKLTKLAEIFIMSVAAFAFYLNSIPLLIGLLFLMGVQSAFFGPLKYSILPQHLNEKEIMAGNGLIEMGTFLAILTGTILGAFLIVKTNGEFLISCVIVVVSVLGYISSLFIKKAESLSSNVKINYNLYTGTKDVFKILSKEKRSVYMSVIAVSWFWFLGAIYLTQLPQFVHNELGYSEKVVTLFLVLFSIGIGFGSMLCEKISKNYIEVGLIPFGAIGITLFGILLYFQVTSYDSLHLVKNGVLLNFDQFMQDPRAIKMSLYLMLIGIFGGFYTVPLYTLIQTRAKKENISRIIAGNNILNSLFMVVASICSIIILKFFNITELFLILSIANGLVAIYICKQIPEFFFRFLTWCLLMFMYRIKTNNIKYVPEDSGAIVIANHVSFVDALLLSSEIKRPLKFIMYYKIFYIPVLTHLFKAMGAIPIAGAKENPEVFKECFVRIKNYLDEGEIVCIFPEGMITHDGVLNEFKSGIEHMAKLSPVPVIPIAINGVYGSVFSRKHKIRIPRKLFRKVNIEVGEPVPHDQVNRHVLYEKVKELMNKN